MSPCTNPLGDAGYGELGGRQPQKDDVDCIATSLEPGQPSGERLARERRLEGKALALSFEFAEPPQHDSTGVEGDVLRSERRQALRQRISVHELLDFQRPAEQSGRGR